MPETKARRVSYLRPQWMTPPTLTLQEALAAALDVHVHVGATVLPVGAGTAAIRHRRVTSSAIYLHVAAWTEGEAVSTVPHLLEDQPEEDLASLVPDSDWDYLDGDGMVLVSANHCLVMPSGLRTGSIDRYLRRLVESAIDGGADIPEEMARFELLPIVNERVADQVRREGTKRIHLNVGQYLETARVGTDGTENIVRRLGRHILDLLVDREEDRRRIEEAENVNARLTITLNGRRTGLEPDDLTPVVERITSSAEDADDIEIETGRGHRIKRGRLLLNKPVKVATFGKTVHHNVAWDELADYFNELREDGALEE